ncbi:hypothetical protein Hanom_Chr12g01111631 [Helianthus anomalus]
MFRLRAYNAHPVSSGSQLLDGVPCCKQPISGIVGAYNSPKACQQYGSYMW